MRDPERIPEILAELYIYWTTPGNEDFRLAQIVGNSASMAGHPGNDPYYFEDDKLLAALKAENERKK